MSLPFLPPFGDQPPVAPVQGGRSPRPGRIDAVPLPTGTSAWPGGPRGALLLSGKPSIWVGVRAAASPPGSLVLSPTAEGPCPGVHGAPPLQELREGWRHAWQSWFCLVTV